MTYEAPTPFRWTGEVMEPLPGFRERCDEQFVVGEVYPLATRRFRSQRTHGHYFAEISDAWRRLPEGLFERFPSPEHLRKWALIRAGYVTTQKYRMESSEHAFGMAQWVEAIEPFAEVVIDGEEVRVSWPCSQSVHAMDKAAFQESKDAVLRVIEELLAGEISP